MTGQGTGSAWVGLAAVTQHVRSRAGRGPGMSTSGSALEPAWPWVVRPVAPRALALSFGLVLLGVPVGSSRASFCTIVLRVVGI